MFTLFPDQRISRSLSGGTSSNVLQSSLWILTPFERVTTPTIGSPGIGEQHLANEYRGDVFLFQRNKAVSTVTKNKNKKELFLPIPYRVFPPEIEKKYKIYSEDYDFNNLYNIIMQKK